MIGQVHLGTSGPEVENKASSLGGCEAEGFNSATSFISYLTSRLCCKVRLKIPTIKLVLE